MNMSTLKTGWQFDFEPKCWGKTGAFSLVFTEFFPNSWFHWNRTPRNSVGQTCFKPSTSYLFDTIHSAVKTFCSFLSYIMKCAGRSSYTVTLVNAKFKEFGTKSNCQPLVKVFVFINLCDRTFISWYLWKRWDYLLTDNDQNYSNVYQDSEKWLHVCL